MNENLKDIKPGFLKKEQFFIIGFFGAILIFIFVLIPPSFKTEGRELSRDAARFVAVGQIRNALEIEYSISKGYPFTIPSYAPQKDSQDQVFHYELALGGFAYKLGACMEGKDFLGDITKCPKSVLSICPTQHYCISSDN